QVMHMPAPAMLKAPRPATATPAPAAARTRPAAARTTPATGNPASTMQSRMGNSATAAALSSPSLSNPGADPMRAQATVGNAAVAGNPTSAPPSQATGLSGKVLNFLRDHARSMPGYDLLGFVLGRDPITQQPIERTAVNLIYAVLALVPGGQQMFQN